MERPVTHRLAVALLEDDLRREILRGAAERPAAVLDVLRKAEVGQLERAVLVRQSIAMVGMAAEGRASILGALERGRLARRGMC